MKKCPKCNANCLDDQKICDSCGFDFMEETTQPEIMNEEPAGFQNEEVKDEAPISDEAQTDHVYEVTEDTMTDDDTSLQGEHGGEGNNKKGNKLVVGLVITGIVALLALASVLAFGKQLFKSGEPEDIIVEAYNQYYAAPTKDISMEISITEFMMDAQIDPMASALADQILKDFVLKIDMRSDMTSKTFEGALVIDVQENELLRADYYLDNQELGLHVPFIHEKGFYVTMDDIKGQIPDDADNMAFLTNLDLFDLSTYESFKDLDENIMNKPVKAFIKENLKTVSKEAIKIGDTSVKCTKYPISFTGSEAMELGIEVIENFLKDEKSRALLLEVIDGFAEGIANENAYDEFDMTEEEFKAGMDKVKEMINDFGKEGMTLEDIFAQANADMEYAQMKMAMELMLTRLNIDMDIYLDKNNKIRKMDVMQGFDMREMGVDLELKVSTVINSFDKKIDFKGIDKENSINPLKMSEEELLELEMQIEETIQKNALENPYLQGLMGGF
ncbi:zinc ribbon domain-containing protein [Vallitalea pronyensis]|uniref:Zinc ribbon domain-containing protein n=1 Tax=Vallitalea pronyensis TaxID=1348613 RepID=A0A8J8SH86_9FIRM|nr:zinc ribbon domain-containing protein [Vallitalea pronyensis]QUI23157.1 zinc ribbon domain-containing protein [Vallitalea pronyensis]